MVELIKALVALFVGGSEKPPRNPRGGIGSAEAPQEGEEKVLQEKEKVSGEEEISQPKVKDDSERLKDEWDELVVKNPELHSLIRDLCEYVKINFQKEVVVTMIYRTQAEQDYLYRDSEKYKKRKFKSPHQFWHAVDLRSWIYSKKERAEMVKFLNERGRANDNYYSWTAKVHEVGSNGLHFHVQYVKNG